jgi:C_GCAxxG_C_C family probable redox protein
MSSRKGSKLPHHEIIGLVRRRAENLYENNRLCCSEALLLVLNQGFNGGLTSEQARQLGSGFCGGMGEAGSTCGALNGAIMGIGLLAGPHTGGGLSKKTLRQLARAMHDRFQQEFSSTCCRVLIKPFDRDRKGRSTFCSGLTATTAAIAAELLLAAMPGLAKHVELEYLASRDSKISGLLRSLPR